MSALVAKGAGKVLGKNKKFSFGSENPYKEPDPYRPNHLRKRDYSRYSPKDAMVMKKMSLRAHRFDEWFSCCCGFRFGILGVIGMIPGFGDILGSLCSYLFVLRVAHSIDGGLPASIHAKMVANIVFDFVVGLVPILGDIVTMAYKCNSRNLGIMNHYMEKKYAGSIVDEKISNDSQYNNTRNINPPVGYYDPQTNNIPSQHPQANYYPSQQPQGKNYPPQVSQANHYSSEPSQGNFQPPQIPPPAYQPEYLEKSNMNHKNPNNINSDFNNNGERHLLKLATSNHVHYHAHKKHYHKHTHKHSRKQSTQ